MRERALLAQHPNNKGFTIKELLVVVCAFGVMIGALTPFVNMARARSMRFYCANNLRQLSLGLHSYAAEHKDAFPETLEELYPRYVDSEKYFDCPASKQVGTKTRPDYVYIGGLNESASPKEIIVEDIDGNHAKRGRNILKVDGSIEWALTRR